MFFESFDGTRLSYEDYGEGEPIVFVAGVMLDADMWEYQIPYFVERGYRCIAFDRRGHGRSDRPSTGYDLDSFADDLAALLRHTGVEGATLVGHSLGSVEVAHYLVRHAQQRVVRAALVSTMLPCLIRSDDNPEGVPAQAVDAAAAKFRADRPKALADQAQAFFASHLNPQVSPAMIDWMMGLCLRPSPWAVLKGQEVVRTADLRDTLPKITVPTLVVHGVADFSAPIDVTGRRTAKLIPGCRYVEYPTAGHGVFASHHEQLNADLLAFITS